MPDQVGDISTKWDEQVERVEARSWVRSYEQHFYTGFRQDFRVHIHMERVKADADGNEIGKQRLCELWTRASDCANDPELGPHAVAIQEHMTALTGILYERWKAQQNSPE